MAKIEKRSNEYKQIKVKNEFKNSLSEIENNLNTLKTKLSINNKKVKLTKSLIKEESKKYSIDQISFDELVQLKYDSFDIENVEIKINYLYSILNWFSVTDNLIGIENELR